MTKSHLHEMMSWRFRIGDSSRSSVSIVSLRRDNTRQGSIRLYEITIHLLRRSLFSSVQLNYQDL